MSFNTISKQMKLFKCVGILLKIKFQIKHAHMTRANCHLKKMGFFCLVIYKSTRSTIGPNIKPLDRFFLICITKVKLFLQSVYERCSKQHSEPCKNYFECKKGYYLRQQRNIIYIIYITCIVFSPLCRRRRLLITQYQTYVVGLEYYELRPMDKKNLQHSSL